MRDILSHVKDLVSDAAKTLELIGKRLSKTEVDSGIKPILSTLQKDADNDVRYFANEAVQALGIKDDE